MRSHKAFGKRVNLIDWIEWILFIRKLIQLFGIIYLMSQIKLLDQYRMGSFPVVNQMRTRFDVRAQSCPGTFA